MAMISLLGLQVQTPSTRVLQLDEHEILSMIASHDWGFRVSYVLSNAYQLHAAGQWTKAIHSQVIVRGNFDFIEEFLDMLVIPPSLFPDVHALFVQSGQSGASQRKNYKKFLSYLPDLDTRARLANEVADFHALPSRSVHKSVFLFAGGVLGYISRLLSEHRRIRIEALCEPRWSGRVCACSVLLLYDLTAKPARQAGRCSASAGQVSRNTR
jgi:hypothetical protein